MSVWCKNSHARLLIETFGLTKSCVTIKFASLEKAVKKLGIGHNLGEIDHRNTILVDVKSVLRIAKVILKGNQSNRASFIFWMV